MGKRVRKYRQALGISQARLAEMLGLSRSAVVEMEKGGRKVTAEELVKLSKIFEVSCDSLLGIEKEPVVKLEKERQKHAAPGIRINVPAVKAEKFRQVLLYLLECVAGKPNVGLTVLYKLLYFADFDFYEMYEEQMTGATYRKQPYGPVPLEFSGIVKDMEKQGLIRVISDGYYGYKQKRLIPSIKADLNLLKASEKEILDRVIERLSDKSAKEISDYSHGDMPWKATAEKEEIDYELAFYREMPYSVRNYKESGNE